MIGGDRFLCRSRWNEPEAAAGEYELLVKGNRTLVPPQVTGAKPAFEAVGISESTIYRTRRRFIEEGLLDGSGLG